MAYACCATKNILRVSQCTRLMSVYPSHYVNPIVEKKLQSTKGNELSHIPIKAAPNDLNDTIFYGQLKQKFLNYITKEGNAVLAKELLTKTFEAIKRTQIERLNLGTADQEKVITDAETLLINAIENSRPLLTLSAIKRGGVKYQVPIPLTERKSYFLAMKWILDAAREKERKVKLPDKLAWEILDAACGQGRVIKKKDDLHRQCETNRAYAHYRWS
ncbi:28S ribosomal protein S7, mitochondrial [Drosophila innubila]|uniref:28S ribosomal protein S7, mitochondrial n=1 Tax=Drosophila innubila TaxID=198719 RepID=UPI00148DA8F7|nr:28S ribosomal protein S7, mitochondrial [Drosophila innubila]